MAWIDLGLNCYAYPQGLKLLQRYLISCKIYLVFWMDGSEFTRALAVWLWILSLLFPLYVRDFLYVLLFLFHPSLGSILLFVIRSLLAWQWERSSVGVYSLCFELASVLGRYCISGLGKGYVSQFSCLYPSCIVVPVYNPVPPWFFSVGSFHQVQWVFTNALGQ